MWNIDYNEIDHQDNGKGKVDEGNNDEDGKDDDGDDSNTDDDNDGCYFSYLIMLNCWQEEPDDRPSFEHLRHELKLMENQHKVIYTIFILPLG